LTCDELKAAINSEIAQNARIAAIRSRMDAGTADFLDSELYTAITAEITAEQMRHNVLALSDREPAFVGVVRERYTDTFNVFNAVQRILDAVTGIRIRTVQPEFENDRAHKIGHSLNDPTVPESVIERRAYSATENFVRSQHDRCTKANASFRSRAGLDCRITRTGGAKCCDWCASVSGSFTTSSAPGGIWGRHDNCKCSITYETRRGSFQQLSGSGMGWDTVEELPDLPLHTVSAEKYAQITQRAEVHFLSGDQIGTGAGEPVVLTAEQAAEREAQHPVIAFSPGQSKSLQEAVLTNAAERGRIEMNDRFYKEGDDPMFEVTGRAIDSHPREVAEMVSRLQEWGVSIHRGQNTLGYGCIRNGEPGAMSITDDASFSAWRHEFDHAEQDRAAGWNGVQVLWFDPAERERRERSAYAIEIQLAQDAGREDIAKRLEANRDAEIEKIWHDYYERFGYPDEFTQQ
jgi:hypothetical protein